MKQSTVKAAKSGETGTQDRNPATSVSEDCPECGGRVVDDEEHGEQTCSDCGVVLAEGTIDRGPEWRSFDDEDTNPSRVGAPTTNLLHDKGLSTTIGWQDADANGAPVTGEKRARLQRLRTWDERYRAKDATERNLKQALGEIERMASALGLPATCRETAGVLYRRALEEGLLPGRSIEGMASACLYASARQHGTPRSLVRFGTVSRVEKVRIQRAYRYLSKELGLKIEPADPLQYVPQHASKLALDDEVERLARELLETAKSKDVHSGKSPSGLAAAALYAAGKLSNEDVTQQYVSDETDVCRVTIRNRYQELLEAQDGMPG